MKDPVTLALLLEMPGIWNPEPAGEQQAAA